MPRLDATPDHRLLLRLLREPDEIAHLSAQQFTRAIDAAEQSRLLGWLVTEADARRQPAAHPAWLADRLTSARAQVREYDRSLRWEIDRLQRAFRGTDIAWTLLKGAGYLAAGLPPGPGRRVADVDVLVPQERLGDAERALVAHGWRTLRLDPYDTRYYRDWMHEIPPMVHRERRSVVDLHHAILPRTSRLQPVTSRLIDRAVDVGGGVRVLCPSHMVVHAAAHLFHDGEIAGAIRDLIDLDGLMRHFSREPGFWDDLIVEARALDLTRPVFYAVRYSRHILQTAVPREVTETMSHWGPPAPALGLMDRLVQRTLPVGRQQGSSTAALALYIRSHWLRMPPAMLARHLFRKSLRKKP